MPGMRRDSARNAAMLALPAALLLGSLGGCSQDPSGEIEDGGVLLLAPADGDPLTDRMVATARETLERVGGSAPQVARMSPSTVEALRAEAEKRRAAVVVLLDTALVLQPDPAADTAAVGEWGYRLQVADVGDFDNRHGSRGATVLASSETHSKLARQYALYEMLRRFGVRHFHPEQAWVPKRDPRDLRALARRPTAMARTVGGQVSGRYVPDFSPRGFSFHGSHPLEHLEAFSDGDHPFGEAERVNDWIVQNRGNEGKGLGRGVAPQARRQKRAAELSALHQLLGFISSAGITLHNMQQGSHAAVDPNSGVPVQKQIEDHVAAQVADPHVRSFGIHFGPTEFTVTPDQETVQWINWAGQKALELRPDMPVYINDHTTGSQPTPHFDDGGCPPGTNGQGLGDYYDLAFHTDPRLGVKVHTVMLYPLEGPAFVYNQKTFAHKLCLMQKASAQGRPLTWFPEGSWWLSYDNPIPVYLPLYIWTRGRDIALVKPLLHARGTGTLRGHRMFDSGHEWGYWQQDYAVGMWHWNADVTLEQVLGELFDPLCAPADWKDGCAARDEAIAVLQEVMTHQKAAFLDDKDHAGLPGGRLYYLSGEDPADEIAAATGFAFRPVRVPFKTVAGWNAKQMQHFVDTDLKALAEMDTLHQGWLDRLAAVKGAVPPEGIPWLAEVVDGLENNQLRARHTRQLYSAVLAWGKAARDRKASATPDQLPTPVAAAQPSFEQASATLLQAEQVIRRREKAYRYPAAQTHGGGLTPQTAVPNGTTYPWRVHTKTHLMTYWHNRHQQVADLLAGKSAALVDALLLRPAIAAPGVPVSATWPQLPGLTADIATGDGGKLAAGDQGHDYGDDPGHWQVSGEMQTEGRAIGVEGHIVRSEALSLSKPAALKLDTPKSAIASSVLKSLFPAMRWAVVPGAAAAVAFAPDLDGDGQVEFFDVVVAPLPAGVSEAFVSAKVDFTLPVPAPGSDAKAASIGVSGATLSGSTDGGVLTGEVTLAGQLSVDDLVQALVDLAGFDDKGALKTLAGVLGFDPDKPPANVPFSGRVVIEPPPKGN